MKTAMQIDLTFNQILSLIRQLPEQEKAELSKELNLNHVETKSKKRNIGILDGKINIEFKDGFEITTEELLDLK